MLVSIATVFFRDLQYLIVIAMQGLFFLTPILYKQEALGPSVSWVVSLNPVTTFVALFRAPLVGGVLPELTLLIQAAMISMLSFAAGVVAFHRYQKNIVFRL
jgi:ABC-type polysaccharide/polyol phosphate export permease